VPENEAERRAWATVNKVHGGGEKPAGAGSGKPKDHSPMRKGGSDGRERMTTSRQRTAARRNVRKAAAAARRKRTIAHLPRKTRMALSKQTAKGARAKKR